MAVISAGDPGAPVAEEGVAVGASAADAWVVRAAATVLTAKAADKATRRTVVRLKGVAFRRSDGR
jgi:hypothetical protein